MNRQHAVCIPAIIICAFLSISWLDPYRDAVSSGNEEFNQKKYNNARRYYDKAERYAPGEDDKKRLAFNRADADFMIEDNDNALTGYQRATQSDDRDVQKKAFFNIGNVYLKQKNYREAINAYMNALKIDPGYDRAKKNIEYVLKHMNKDNKDNKDKKDNKDNKQDKDRSGQNKQDKKNQNKNQDGRQGDNKNRTENAMSRDQVKNILRSLQQSPVRRQKGSGDGKRKLEKYW